MRVPEVARTGRGVPVAAYAVEQTVRMATASRMLAAGIAVTVAVTLVGCTPMAERRLEDRLRVAADDAARDAGFISQDSGLGDPSDAIGAYARRIVDELERTGVAPGQNSGWFEGSPDSATALRLVGIEPFADAEWGDPVGALLLASRLDIVSEQTERDFCLRIEFDRWGASSSARAVGCPDPLTTVTPPADARPVIPDGAEEIVLAALAGAGDASAAEATAELTERLAPLTGGIALAEVQVVRDGDRIGFAMSDVDDCLLVRADDRGIESLHPPRVRIQPGELGCFASTALLPDEAFRAPH